MKALIAISLLFLASFDLNIDEEMTIRAIRLQQALHDAKLDIVNKELHCMTENLIYEAGGEGIAGQIAVAQVVMNRLNNPKYPKTICGVIYQPNQFSWTNSTRNRKYGRIEYEEAKIVAINVINKNVSIRELQEATHYHAVYVTPYWAAKSKKLLRLKNHIFYKEPQK